jgi:hypothetical protein
MADQPTAALDQALRSDIYGHFVAHGSPPDPASHAAQRGLSAEGLAAAYERLAAQRALVLDSSGAIWMAIPFSAVPTDVLVRARGVSWWANCAFDGLGIPAMLGVDAQIETACPQSGAPIALSARGADPPEGTCVLHMAVPLAQWWDNIGDT